MIGRLVLYPRKRAASVIETSLSAGKLLLMFEVSVCLMICFLYKLVLRVRLGETREGGSSLGVFAGPPSATVEFDDK